MNIRDLSPVAKDCLDKEKSEAMSILCATKLADAGDQADRKELQKILNRRIVRDSIGLLWSRFLIGAALLIAALGYALPRLYELYLGMAAT